MPGNERLTKILRIIVKYMPIETGRIIELFIIMSELRSKKHQVNAPPSRKPDIHEILNEIREQCDEKDSGMINMILGAMNAMDFYNNNKELINMLFSQLNEAQADTDCHNTASETDVGCHASTNNTNNCHKNNQSTNNDSNTVFSMLSSFLTSEQQASFEMLQGLMNNGTVT